MDFNRKTSFNKVLIKIPLIQKTLLCIYTIDKHLSKK